MVTVDAVRRVAMSLPGTSEHLINHRVKFRAHRVVYAAISLDRTSMGLAFPKEWRETFVAAEPDRFRMPAPVDLPFNWMRVSLGAIDQTEMRELLVDAWCFVVPKRVASAYLELASIPDIGDDPPAAS
jgi:hypothetical protein